MFLHQQHEATVQQSKKLQKGAEEPWNLQTGSRVLDFSYILSLQEQLEEKGNFEFHPTNPHTKQDGKEEDIVNCALEGEQTLWCSPRGQALTLIPHFQAIKLEVAVHQLLLLRSHKQGFPKAQLSQVTLLGCLAHLELQ